MKPLGWHDLGPDPDAGAVEPPRDIVAEQARVLSAQEAFNEHARTCVACNNPDPWDPCGERRILEHAVLSLERRDAEVQAGKAPNLRRVCTSTFANEIAAIAAVGALDVARDAHLEHRLDEERAALAEVPNVLVPEIGLKLHDVYEWERIFEDVDRRRDERASAWDRHHGKKNE